MITADRTRGATPHAARTAVTDASAVREPRRTRAARRLAPLVVPILVVPVMVLAGCASGTPTAAVSDPPSTTASSTPSGQAPEAHESARTVSFSSGTIRLTVRTWAADGTPPSIATAGDVTTISLPAGRRPAELVLESGHFSTYADGSVSVLSADGSMVGGLYVGLGPQLTADGEVLSIGADHAVAVTLGTRGIEREWWGNYDDGRSLAVDPTAWARSSGEAGRALAWNELTALVPEADTPAMHDQFICHALGAADKATWNLEPWRPDVGLLATMQAGCNPR